MKLPYEFEKMSDTWHYQTHAPPTDELRKLGHTSLGKEEIACIDRLLEAPLDCGGIKRIHSGNPALDIKNDSIDKRSHHMRNIGYNEHHYFIEFNENAFPTINQHLKEKYQVTYDHDCAIIVPPGQCMPAHGDTYGYLTRYMHRDYADVQFNLKENACRYLMFLTDWEWGQSFGAGNVLVWQWKRGDIYEWDHRLIHWCSNSGFSPLMFFEITGLQL